MTLVGVVLPVMPLKTWASHYGYNIMSFEIVMWSKMRFTSLGLPRIQWWYLLLVAIELAQETADIEF